MSRSTDFKFGPTLQGDFFFVSGRFQGFYCSNLNLYSRNTQEPGHNDPNVTCNGGTRGGVCVGGGGVGLCVLNTVYFCVCVIQESRSLENISHTMVKKVWLF